MTHRIKSVCFTLFAAMATSAMAAETRVAVVNVPFAFTAGSYEMPAGEYSISKNDQRILFLRTAGKTVAVLPIASASPGFSGSANAVRFERVGGRTVLKEVVVGGVEGFLLRK